MMKNLKTELLKLKSSSAMYMLISSPLIFLAFAIFTALFAQGQPDKNKLSPYLSLTFNLWPFFVIPILTCIVANSLLNMEIKNNHFSYYKSNNWSINSMIKNKIIVTIIGFIIHAILIFIVSMIGNALTSGAPINPLLIFVTITLILISSLSLIPINFILVRNTGVFLAIFLNLFLSILSIITITMTKIFWILPWSYIGRIPLITLSLHPNGTLLSKSSPFFNDLHALLIVLIVSTIYFVAFFFLNNNKSWRIK